MTESLGQSFIWNSQEGYLQTLKEFFLHNQLPVPQNKQSLSQYWQGLTWESRANKNWNLEGFLKALNEYAQGMEDLKTITNFSLQSLQILGGQDKTGVPENLDITFFPGDLIAIVGPTGAGKSRFLGDIEDLVQKDSPTKRQILINCKPPEDSLRFSVEGKPIAQLSQNMNFVMDLAVQDFLILHAQSRFLNNPEQLAQEVWEAAISLAGESFSLKTPLTQLSGGQSRALMIADTAKLSPKPIVLIDEIENAGIDRRKALEFFQREGKIVFLSTHDPMLTLSCSQRLVIQSGAVQQVLKTSEKELELLPRLQIQDTQMNQLRNALRQGLRIEDFPVEIMKQL